MYQTAHQNDGFNALRLNCINLTLPACAMIPNQQNFTRHNERFNFPTIFSGCQIGQVRVTFNSDQLSDFILIPYRVVNPLNISFSSVFTEL